MARDLRMDDLDARLARCFAMVFPEESLDALPAATMDSLQTWDSVALVILVNVVEEEFAIKFRMDDLSEFTSFASFSGHLHRCGVR
ncbi:MAG TPA: acyl carrier protein [Bryobacteraceae bacterium]|nr:acyl carrier protein [Bryobacteraceae bacterium]